MTSYAEKYPLSFISEKYSRMFLICQAPLFILPETFAFPKCSTRPGDVIHAQIQRTFFAVYESIKIAAFEWRELFARFGTKWKKKLSFDRSCRKLRNGETRENRRRRLKPGGKEVASSEFHWREKFFSRSLVRAQLVCASVEVTQRLLLHLNVSFVMGWELAETRDKLTGWGIDELNW